MHVQRITTEIINDFNECTLKRDYRNFYNNHRSSIKRSAEDFKFLNISNSQRCHFITQNLLLILKFLKDYPRSDPKQLVYYTVETGDPEFVADIKMAIDSRNWDSFYRKYWRIADFIINQARVQGVLNITIEWNNSFYESFDAIESATASSTQLYPSQNANSGTMLVIRPGPTPLIRQSSRNSSPNKPAESTQKRKDSFYRQTRDKYSPSSENPETGTFSRTEPYSDAMGILLNASTLTRSSLQTVHLPAATNGSYNGGMSQTPSRVSTISYGSTGTSSDVRSTSRNSHRGFQSSHYQGSSTSRGEPYFDNAGSGVFDCCRNSERSTGGFENNTALQRTWDTGRVQSATVGNSSEVISMQPVSNINNHFISNKPSVPPHRTNDARDKPYEGFSSQPQSHTGYPSNIQQDFYSPVANQFVNGHQYSQYQESSPRDQVVEHNYSRDQLPRQDNGSKQYSHDYQNEQGQESFVTGKNSVADTNTDPAPVKDNEETYYESRTETHSGISPHPKTMVTSQTSSFETTHLSNQELPRSQKQRGPEVRESTLEAERPTEPTSIIGIPLHPHLGVQSQTWSSENVNSSYQNFPPSEARDQSLPEPNGTFFRSKNWETPEPTLTGFSIVDHSDDSKTLKKDDDSFETLGSDTVRPDDEHPNKQLYEDFEVVDVHRSSMSSINIDFSPVEDSIISHQSCFDLDDLRRTNDTPVESIDGNFDDEIFKHQVEMSQVNRDVMSAQNLIAEELADMQKQQTIRPSNSDLTEDEDDNSDFNQKFAEMKRQQAEELRRIREERRRKQKLLDDELQKMRKESKERFRMFMTCIILKQRFEQQEDKWKDWIRDCRNNIVALQKYFLIFEETYRRIFNGSKKKQADSDDLDDFESEKGNFSRYVMNTYNALENDFETLKNIEQHYNDAMFLRVLQKCIADVAKMLLEISAITFSLNSDSFSRLDEKMSKLAVDLIYSTTKLRSVCSQAEDWKYQNVQFPRTESNYNIEETY